MAVPKKRKSKAKTRTRRSANDKISAPTINGCPLCGAPRRPHRACMECGHYGTPDDNEQVIEVWEY